LTIGSNFVSTFSPCLNVGSFICMLNFEVTFRNRFKRGGWEFVLKVGTITILLNKLTFSCLHALCLYTFNPRFYAKGNFGGVRNHGVNGH